MSTYLMTHFQIIAHGCHFRVMFKTKGFSSNNSLKRRAVIVDAPDLPPEECEFYITSVGIADTDKVDFPTDVKNELELNLEQLYEEKDSEDTDLSEIPLTNVTGIGKGTSETLREQGIASIEDLMAADPETLSEKINGVSPKKVTDWQKSAKALIDA